MKLAAILLLPGVAHALPTFRDAIPNGRSVPHPTIDNAIWAGVGHLAVGGGGPRNPFGLAFAAQGYSWTTVLCEADSDGDGRSNGVELGDPDCMWSAGQQQAPSRPAQSHPGIVDEPSSTLPTDTCKDYDPPDDTQELEIGFSVPNQLDGIRTQYVCEQMQVQTPAPGIEWFHQIKSQPLVDTDVLHHMWIYLCDGASSDGNRVGEGAYACNGIEGNCQIVAGWALGGSDFCEPSHVGALLPFSNDGSAVFKVEAHYDNSKEEVTTDQSGMRLHLTSQLRTFDSGQVIVGMDYYDRQFTLPPGQTNAQLTNICPTKATQRLNHAVWVYTWNPHMHLYGTKLVTEHYRCGRKIGEIGNIDGFEFDNQQTYVLETPIKILPGDALVTTCTFDTMDATQSITGGEETTNEMCDNYLTYYPSAYTVSEPSLFTACSSFDQGINPAFVDYDDTTPFASLDLSGSIFVENYESDPTQNLAPCCSTETCEQEYLSRANQACAIDLDCVNNLVCESGVCVAASITPTPAPTPAPVGFGCFPGTSSVEILNQSKRELKDVQLGDMVHVGNGRYEPLYSFGHYDPHNHREYLEITTDKTSLQVSKSHMLFTVKNGATSAKLVQVGDELIDGHDNKLTVNAIKSVQALGMFAPLLHLARLW